MVRAHDVRQDPGLLHLLFELFGNYKIINSPPDVARP